MNDTAEMEAVDAWRSRVGARRDRRRCGLVVVSHLAGFDGGAEFVFRDIVAALRERSPDLDMTAIYPQPGPLAAETARLGVQTRRSLLPWWSWQRSLIIAPFVDGIMFLPGVLYAVLMLLRLRPTVVVTNTMVIPSYAVAAKLLGIPHVWFVHEFGKADHRFRFLLGYRTTIRVISHLSASVICCSRAVEKTLTEIVPTMTTHVIYPAIEDEPLGTPPERRHGENMRTVLVGSYLHSKGQHVAVEAIAVARKAGVDIQLALVGPGDRTHTDELVRRLGVEDLVSLHGPTDDVRRYWSAAHVALMCSGAEAFGRVTVEAMRAGLPVCGTDTGGTPEIIDSEVNGLLSPAGEPHALAANLMVLESDDGLRRRLAFRAVETSRHFQRDRYGDDIAAVIGLP